MPVKIAWFAFWVTMTFWLGHFWGCAAPGEEQNYRILDDDTPVEIDRSEPPGLQSRKEIADLLEISVAESKPVDVSPPAPKQSAAGDVIDPEAPIELREPIAPADHPTMPKLAEAPALPAERIGSITSRGIRQPSLRGLDRSHWATLRIGPASGTTYHGRYYFVDANLRADQEPRISESGGSDFISDLAINEVFDRPSNAGPFDGTNLVGIFVQPMKFMVDLATIPISAMVQSPLSQISTPPGREGLVTDGS